MDSDQACPFTDPLMYGNVGVMCVDIRNFVDSTEQNEQVSLDESQKMMGPVWNCQLTVPLFRSSKDDPLPLEGKKVKQGK